MVQPASPTDAYNLPICQDAEKDSKTLSEKGSVIQLQMKTDTASKYREIQGSSVDTLQDTTNTNKTERGDKPKPTALEQNNASRMEH